MRSFLVAVASSCVVLTACVADPGVRPADTSEVTHEATAPVTDKAELQARACAGLTPEDREKRPFAHREDIESVRELKVTEGGSKDGVVWRMAGAVVVVRAKPGMTAQWLNRIIDCHVAADNALGPQSAESADWPLVPVGASARATPTDTGFAVAIQSNDSTEAQEILRRAKALLTR